MKMFCSKCGNELLTGAKFCGRCGNPIVTNEEKTEVIAAEAVVEKEHNTPQFLKGRQTSEIKFTNISTPDSQGFWICKKCGFDKNADYTDLCSCCKTNKYSWEVLTDEERETIVEYVNLQMENNNFNDIYELERNYYNTSSLLYLKNFFSGKLNYESIETYRASLNASIQEEKTTKEQKPEVVHEKVKEEKVEEKTPDVSQENKITINDVVELYQIVCEVCGYGLAKINGTKEIKEINKLMSPMKEYGLEEYKHNPVNMTDWNLYTQKLAEFIYKLK